MKTYLALLSLIAIIMVTSCSKDGEETTTYTLSGLLLASCDSVPLANKEIFLYSSSVNFGTTFIKLAQGVTDNEGRFVINYDAVPQPESPLYGDGLHIKDKDLTDLINLPVNRDVKDIFAVFSHSQVFDVYLKVINPYNNEHQIHYFDNGLVKHIIDGPFSDEFLYQKEISMTGGFRHPLAPEPHIAPWWSLNFSYDILGPTIINEFNPGSQQKTVHANVTYVPCGEKVDVEILVE